VDWKAQGCSADAALRVDPSWGTTPVVLLTPFEHSAAAEHWRNLGFADSVTKPVKQGELESCLADLLGLDAPPSPARSSPDHVVDSATARARRAPYRILVAEDNATNQEVAAGMLRALGYPDVTLAGNGQEALDALSRAHFDLVFMDCQMPELDGYEATRRIRHAGSPVRNPRVPVVAMTAHALVTDRALCLAAGMDDYITKPVHAGALEQILERWLPSAGAEATRDAVPIEQPTAPRPPAVFDKADLLRRLFDDEAFADSVVELFLADLPGQQSALADALRSGDVTAVRSMAHTIKGAAATAGAVQLSLAARDLEHCGQTGNLERVRGGIADLDAQAVIFRAATQACPENAPRANLDAG
jgi:CheY-like chemotaxis protein/HPt (histidine-containing phosphotransfer) domain-containing protein